MPSRDPQADFPPPRFGTQRNPSRQTLGPAVGVIMRLLGQPPMPWQQYVLDVACEIDPDAGNYFYREVRLIVMRQQGKTTLMLGKGAHRCLAWPRQRLVYTAQTRNMARRRLEEDFCVPLADSPFADMLVQTANPPKGFRAQAGSEHIGFTNNSRWWIDAVTKKAGHGPPLDEGHIDEAFAHVDNRIETAMRPAMATKPNAQLWIASAAGDGDSTYLRDKVEDGRARIRGEVPAGRVAYFEWSAPDDADPDDPQVWRDCMPALGHTITEDVVRSERDSMADDEFRRSYLNQWRDKKQGVGVFAPSSWAECAVPDDDGEVWRGEPMWTLDVSPLRDITSFGLAAEPADENAQVFIECVGQINGTEGAVEKLVELRSMFGGSTVAVSRVDAAASLRPDLEAAGFTVLLLSARDKADACGSFYDAVLAGLIRHMNDPVLNSAVSGARKRDMGEGAWLFTRKALADITPLYSVILARWAWLTSRPTEYDIADSLG